MYVLDRILVRIYSLIVALGTVWVALWLFGVPIIIMWTHHAVTTRTWIWLYFIVLFALSIRYLFFRVEPRITQAFIKDGELGQIRISFATVNELARRAAKQVKGVEHLLVRVEETSTGLVVWVKVRAHVNIDLTTLSEEIQQQVSESILRATSLKTTAVHVQIQELAPEALQK